MPCCVEIKRSKQTSQRHLVISALFFLIHLDTLFRYCCWSWCASGMEVLSVSAVSLGRKNGLCFTCRWRLLLITQGTNASPLITQGSKCSKSRLKIWGVLTAFDYPKATINNNHPLAPEVSGSTCKPVIFLQGKEGSIKKKSLCAASNNFPEKCRKPMVKLNILPSEALHPAATALVGCEQHYVHRRYLAAGDVKSLRPSISGDATPLVMPPMPSKWRWRWNIFQITGDLKISICLVLPLIPPTHKGFTYILCN